MSDNKNRRIHEMREMRDSLNSISPTMCVAKWLQTTVNLQNGFTHSCHHPPAHKIPLSEIAKSPKALHNTIQKQAERKQMLDGERPAGCQYCWNIEDLPGDHLSDRVYKAYTPWGWPHHAEVVESGVGKDINPTYLEVSFDSTCNLKCAYCSPDISSKWMEEIKQLGPYKTSNQHNNLDYLKTQDRMPIPNREHNPYVDAFWEWWPELYKTVKVFRITGGEPLLSKNLWRIFDYVLENPKEDFNLCVNTNLAVPDDIIDKFVKYAKSFADTPIKFDVFTSAEAHGDQCDYIRYGMDYDKFLQNINKLLDSTEGSVQVHMMIAYNALSITSYDKFLDDILDLRKKYNPPNKHNMIMMMLNYVRWPKFMDVRILPREITQKYGEIILNKIRDNLANSDSEGGFFMEELDQVERLIEYMNQSMPELEIARTDFGKYFEEYDRRRNVDIRTTFPELVPFYEECLYNGKT